MADKRSIRVVFVDDDSYVSDELRDLLTAMPEVELLGDFRHPLEAIPFIRSTRPDLLFLDIQMPVMNGFEMLDQLPQDWDFDVVFITSYNQYAIQAIKYSALDYLLKPIGVSELNSAIGRYNEKAEKIKTRVRLSNLKHNLSANSEQEFKLVLLTKQGDHHFKASEIIRCEADSNYTQIHLSTGKKFLASKTLSGVEEMLSGESFIRIHKSHLINLFHVSNLTSEDEILMSDRAQLPISRRRLNEVRFAIRNKAS
jgi:two-component system, LytTR family, response regulator